VSEYRGLAGCPQCKVPWVVEDWATYLSVKCPHCGRNLGEVALGSGHDYSAVRGAGEKSATVPATPLPLSPAKRLL
jgi:hypothetical protein